MTVQELYEAIGGNYEGAKQIMMADNLIARIIVKLLNDDSCARMLAAEETMDPAELFEGAHAMKGVYANLGLDTLSRAAGEISEEFRPGNPRRLSDEEVHARLAAVRAQNQTAMDAIRRFAEEQTA